MNIIAKGTILYYIKKYPIAKTALLVWVQEFSKLDCDNFNELKSVYGAASIVAKSRVIFNIKGNDFRLLVSINFTKKAVYVIWFGTHKEYNKVDILNQSFDINISKLKE